MVWLSQLYGHLVRVGGGHDGEMEDYMMDLHDDC